MLPRTQYAEILRFQFTYLIASVLKRERIEFLKARSTR